MNLARIKIGYVSGGSTEFNADADEFVAWLKDDSRPAHSISNEALQTIIFKDKICFVEISK